MALVQKTVGDTVSVHASPGDWYTSNASKFSATILDLDTNVEAATNVAFVERHAGDYTMDISPAVGRYVIYVTNPDLWSGAFPVPLDMLPVQTSPTLPGHGTVIV